MIVDEIEITLIEKKLRKTINQYFFKKNNVER